MGFLRISKESHYLLDYIYYVELNSINSSYYWYNN